MIKVPPSNQRHSIAGTAFSLDQHWSEILHLFESHSHIRSARCSLAMLAQLARRYQPRPAYLRATLAQLANICDLAQKNQLTKHEMDLHGEAIAGTDGDQARFDFV